MRVLIIDDNRDSSYLVSVLVKHLGHDAMVLTAPQAAVDVAKEYKPEVVFMDLVMPGLDGYEVARQLRDRAGLNGAKILAISGYPRNAVQEQASGIDGYIPKPVTATRLKTLLGDERETTTKLKVQHVH